MIAGAVMGVSRRCEKHDSLIMPIVIYDVGSNS